MSGSLAPVVLWLLLGSHEDAAVLIERLGSERVEERDGASRTLKALGAAVLPELARHEDHADPEVRARVRSLQRVLRIRQSLPSRLIAALPGIDDLLDRGDWRNALAMSNRKGLRVGPGEQAPLALQALEIALRNGELSAFCEVVLALDYRPALPALRSRQFDGSADERSTVQKALVAFARKATTGTTLLEQRIVVPIEPTVRVFGHQVGGADRIPAVRTVRFVMIENKLYEEGDVLADFGVRIHRIWAHGVEVRPLDRPPLAP